MRVHGRVCQAQGPTGAKVLLRALHKLKSSQDVGGGGRGGQRSLPGLVLQDLGRSQDFILQRWTDTQPPSYGFLFQ